MKQEDINKSAIEKNEGRINKLEDMIRDLDVITHKKHIERGKSLEKLWEKGKELKKEFTELKNFCGKLIHQIAVLHLENRITVPSATGLIDVQSKQFLVKDIVRQMIDESGYDLGFKVLRVKYPTQLKELRKTLKKK